MTNLILGGSSQLAYFLEGTRVSARDIPDRLIEREWDRVYICFAEQRTFMDTSDSFMKVNFDLTKKVIEKLYNHCVEFIFYSTAMLWSGRTGDYDLSCPYSYKESDYLVSKEKITEYLKGIDKVKIHYPCNFNSRRRKGGFLFASLYDVINNKKSKVRCLDFEKEIAHASYIANKSMNTFTDSIIAPGYCVNVRTLFTKILDTCGKDIEEWLEETATDTFVKPNSYCYNIVDEDYLENKLVSSFVEELK